MRSTINSLANLTTTVIANVLVRTVVAGVDALRGTPAHALRLYAAPSARQWQFPAKQEPGHKCHMSGGDESRCRRDESRCRRPRSGCWRVTS
jgi:hypothetical protein